MCCVSVFRCRRGDAEVAVQHVAALDHRRLAELLGRHPARCTSTLGWNQVPSPRSLTRWRIHHTTSAVVVTPGVITRAENASRMTSHARG
jgi:hypothetical protein